MALKIDSAEALRGFVEARIPTACLGMLLRAAFNAFDDAFKIFYATPTEGVGAAYEPFHPATAINTIPGIIRSRLEGRFPTIADQFRESGIKWSIGANTSKNHGHFELLVGDDLRIIVTKYNNGTTKINVNKKKLDIAVMNGMDSLFPEIIEESSEKPVRHTIYVVYGYNKDLFEAFEFNADLIDDIHLVFPGIDAIYGNIKQIPIDLMEYAMYMPNEAVNIGIMIPTDVDEDIELKPNRNTEEADKKKRGNDEG